jgi:hypothetical protein
MRSRFPLLVFAVAVLAVSLAAFLFPRALPIVALEQTLTRETALARADSFLRAHALAPAGARMAVQFGGDDSLRTFIELAGGGHDSLNALVRGRDVAPYAWAVRAFVPGNPREARVDLAPDGRIIGFERTLAEADTLPALAVDSARRLAELVLGGWIHADRTDRWTLVSSSFETQKTSGRVDRTFTFERTDRRVSGAPIRAEVVIAGDTPSEVRPFVEIPQSFQRRYGEMRSWNQLLSLLASLGILAVAILGIVALSRYARTHVARWREPMVVGGVIGVLTLAAALNELPGSWFWYDTAMSPTTFRLTQWMAALTFGITTGLMTGFTLAAAEGATRQAFPRHLDWWKLWRYRGTREVGSQVLGGYAVASVAFAYVAVFYLVTRTLFGWWVPSEVLDDPNQIASPMPWVSGIAISLNAGVWEEALFRALPLSLLSLWVGQRPGRRWWMAGGVVVTALVFGFAHSDYESWPPYSRGVEIFLDACFWAVLFLRFGLLLTVVAHVVYDAVLFGIFAASGSAPAYRVTAAIILLALLAPALVVLWRRLRQGGFTTAPEEARFGAWVPGAVEEPVWAEEPARVARVFTARARRLAVAAGALGLAVAIGQPLEFPLGPAFTARRAHVTQTADSMLRAHGGDPARWDRRLATIGNDTLQGWSRFLREHELTGEAQRFAATYVPATWWVVRYVNTTGTAAHRTEEWRVRVWPDGRPLDIRHLLPDSARRDTADAAAVRSTARLALARIGVDTLMLSETNVRETARPARRDVRITYTDTSVTLPAGAAARAWVDIGGDEPLVARRGVELPEAFLRADRARETNRLVAFGVVSFLLLGVMIAGALLVRKRRPIVLDDDVPQTGRQAVVAVAMLAVLMLLSTVNSLPSQLYSYDTAEPWSNFLGSTALGFVAPLIFALVTFGLWRGLDALRRRVGVPMRPHEASPTMRADVLVAGIGLGGLAYALSGILTLLARQRLPSAPSTNLDALVPPLAGVPDLPGAAVMTVVMLALPMMVVAGITRRWAFRVLIAALVVALLGVAAWATGPSEGDVDPLLLAGGVVAAALLAAACLAWGSRAAWSWIVAALAFQALEGLRGATHAAVWEGRVAGALLVVFATALIVLIGRRVSATERRSFAAAEPTATQTR